MNHSAGFFISFEGIDGAGKSTHIQTLAKVFQQKGRLVTLTREPGGTELSEKLREIVLNETMDPMTEALLVFAARRDHLVTTIEPALALGHIVLCDRFTDATFAYQGAGRGFDRDFLSILEKMVQSTNKDTISGAQVEFRQPDLTIWFDLPASVAASRLTKARSPDRFEGQSEEFFQRVSKGYAQRHRESPQRFEKINADQHPDLVWKDVKAVFDEKEWLEYAK